MIPQISRLKADLSVIIPLLNERGSLPELYQRLTEVLREINREYEIIFVDDGSSDGSVELMPVPGRVRRARHTC